MAAVIAVMALLLGACGSDNNTNDDQADASNASERPAVDCAAGTISGAGSTFVQTITQQWIKDFGAACSGATVNYQGVGSGAGIQQFTAGTVDFAGSDVAMTAEEETTAQAKLGPVVHIPWSAGGIAIEYHLEGLSDLKLTPEALAGIFAGTITEWDDPAIKSSNAGASLPSKTIEVVHRSDGSGTTAAFTSYLTAVAPSVWTFGSSKDVPWPTGEGAKGSDGVTAAVKQNDGTIGYAELSFARGASLGVARIGNAAGAFVAPDARSVAAALESATVPDDLKIKVDYQPESAAAYPISTTTFVIVPQNPADAARAKLVRSFVLFALGAGQASADDLYYAPLPESILVQAKAAARSVGS